MKRLLLAAILLTSTLFLKAQNTTEEEFNFMLKGFQTMRTQGLDMKKGYILKDTASFTASDSKYTIVFINMLREKDKSLAGTIVMVQSHTWNKLYYLAMPASSSDGDIDLQKNLMAQINNYAWDANIKTAFIQALAEYLVLNLTKQQSKKK